MINIVANIDASTVVMGHLTCWIAVLEQVQLSIES